MKKWKRTNQFAGKVAVRENGKWLDHESAQVSMEREEPRTESPFLGLMVALLVLLLFVCGAPFEIFYPLVVMICVGAFIFHSIKGARE